MSEKVTIDTANGQARLENFGAESRIICLATACSRSLTNA
jgi:hypothetical protein